jgi:hypothetical protein
MAQKIYSAKLGGFSGTKAYIVYVEIPDKGCNAAGRIFCDPLKIMDFSTIGNDTECPPPKAISDRGLGTSPGPKESAANKLNRVEGWTKSGRSCYHPQNLSMVFPRGGPMDPVPQRSYPEVIHEF